MKNVEKLIEAIEKLNNDRIELVNDRGGCPSGLDEDGHFLSQCIDDLVDVTNSVIREKNSREE